jgi:hypothetical protein
MANRTFLLLRILAYTVFVAIFILVWNSDFGYVYRKHFVSNSNLVLDFNDLDSNTTEADIKKRYPINWYCRSDNSIELGDYFCADELKTWNNIPALTVVFWFKRGKLNAAKVDLPLWSHDELLSELKSRYGEPKFFTNNKNNVKLAKNVALHLLTRGLYDADQDVFHDRLGIWYLPKRTQITTSLENESNLFSHNTILWQVY